jgi:predicted nucleic acid-binding protein
MLGPCGFRTYHKAAAIFRLARAKAITLATIDTLIAAIDVDHGARAFSLDKDFAPMARMANLPLYPLPD